MSFRMSERYKKYSSKTSVDWYPRTGYDDYSVPTYGDIATPIKVRKVEKTKIVKDNQGNDVVSKAYYMTTDNVNVEDKIDGNLVISTENATDRENVTIGKLVYV